MPVVKIEGTITSIEKKEKDGKVSTEILLAQKGQRQLTPVRLNGDRTDFFAEFEIAEFEGNLMMWKTRDSIGHMVMVND